jgi:flagellar hook-basal body complex protein FliE
VSAIAPIELTPLATSEAIRPRGVDLGEGPAPLADSTAAAPVDSFSAFLGNAVEEANRADLAASQKVEALASGAIDDLHGTMISVKEAEIAVKLVGTVRNKILDAFQELWKTSV